MAQYGPRLVVPIDVKKKPREQKVPLHNRWHPDIPHVAEAVIGEVFKVEMMDFSGGGITKDYTADDIKHAEPFVVSFLLLHIIFSSRFLFFGFDIYSFHLYITIDFQTLVTHRGNSVYS